MESTTRVVINPCSCNADEKCDCNPQLNDGHYCPCHIIFRDAIFKDNYLNLYTTALNRHFGENLEASADFYFWVPTLEQAEEKLASIQKFAKFLHFSGVKYSYSFEYRPFHSLIVPNKTGYLVRIKSNNILTISIRDPKG